MKYKIIGVVLLVILVVALVSGFYERRDGCLSNEETDPNRLAVAFEIMSDEEMEAFKEYQLPYGCYNIRQIDKVWFLFDIQDGDKVYRMLYRADTMMCGQAVMAKIDDFPVEKND